MEVHIKINRPRWLRGRPRWLVRGLAVAAAVAVLVPGAAFAIHNFTDVPDTHVAHGDIDAIRRAGITAGANCPPAAAPSYCPNNNVTRSQMASFLNRGLSRVALETTPQAPVVPATGSEVPVVNETVLVPGTSGTGLVQYVKADAQVGLYGGPAGCPCVFAFRLTDGSSSSPWSYVQAESGPLGFIDNTYSLSWVFARPAGSTATITVVGRFSYSTTSPPEGHTYGFESAQVILTTFPTAADGAIGVLGSEQSPGTESRNP